MMRNEATGHRKLTLKMVFILRTQWQGPAAAAGRRLRGEFKSEFLCFESRLGFGGVSFKTVFADS